MWGQPGAPHARQACTPQLGVTLPGSRPLPLGLRPLQRAMPGFRPTASPKLLASPCSAATCAPRFMGRGSSCWILAPSSLPSSPRGSQVAAYRAIDAIGFGKASSIPAGDAAAQTAEQHPSLQGGPTTNDDHRQPDGPAARAVSPPVVAESSASFLSPAVAPLRMPASIPGLKDAAGKTNARSQVTSWPQLLNPAAIYCVWPI